ncbi:MAG: SLC13 family permease [Lysobacterales bacterium]
MPNIWIAVVLLLVVTALALFATERIRLENAAFIIFITLLVIFGAFPFTANNGEPFDATNFFEAFGNEALVAVCALMVLGKGIETTRALQPLVAIFSQYWSRSPSLMLVAVMAVSAVLSAFLNNTPIVVMMLPALIAIAHRNNMTPSKILLPFGFATIIGGMATTIGTSTNLLVVTLSKDLAGITFSMFSFSWYVVVAGVAGVAFLSLLGPKLMPERRATGNERSEREFSALLRIRSDSRLVGLTVADLLNLSGHKLTIDQIEDQSGMIKTPLPTLQLNARDRVSVRGNRHALKEAENVLQAPLTDLEDASHGDPATQPKLFEVLVTTGAGLNGKTLSEIDFQSRFGVAVVALHRPKTERRGLRGAPEHAVLGEGDVILCQGTRQQLFGIQNNSPLYILHEAMDLPATHKSNLALGITGAVVVVAAFGILPIAISALLGVGLMIFLRCLGWRHVGEALNTQVILVIAVSLALGKALIVTGGDAYLAAVFSHVFSSISAFMVVLALMSISALLTNIVTNNAAAVITIPIAIQIAQQLEIATEPAILAVLFGANLSFLTPIGYQTNLLILNDGGYKFWDFLRLGGPLTLLMGLILAGLLKFNYGL